MTTPLQRLVRLAPPAVTPPPTDWSDAERRLGRPLPQDYKELVDTYGSGEFDEHVRLRGPDDTAAGRGIISMNDGYFEELEDIWEMNEEAPEEIAEEGTTLVVWARTKDADTLNWLVLPGQAAEEWTVMVLNDDASVWEHYDMNGTAFLAAVLAGDIDSGILSCEL
ncbi:MAG: SMI1/KNR4 family protein, partial [Streptomycetaceae bacterium]|nr:SMI1/KNR4 family protein [Streptomycetaceae bacterium]